MSAMPPPSTAMMANAIRALSMDAVQKANSGHPGAPMGMADMAVALWGRHLRHNPTDPTWFDRDRFVLSNGHASMLLYSVLHLSGYALNIDDLKAFRQMHSKTPGHPEVGITPGVETTTGPLGQGLANAVGMALAEKHLASEFNRPGFGIVDHFTYVFMGDGCLMEGISHEACALAASFQLSKLIVMYDDNGISIDGQVAPWFGDDTVKRFQAYGWNVIPNVDGHDAWALDKAIVTAKEWAAGRDGKFAPTLIQCRTVIGKGSPARGGTSKAHGEPLGDAEIAATRAVLEWPYGPFEIPESVYGQWDARASGAQQQALWEGLFEQYQQSFPDLASAYERRMRSQLSGAFDDALDSALEQASSKAEKIATRKASQNALNAFGPALNELLGGSADLTGSNLTDFAGVKPMRPTSEDGVAEMEGRHINYGVREFGMAAVMNGLALHGGFIPYGGTFLTFSDYSRNAIRMASLMKLRVVHVFTHDSIGLGEDGPTHQSVEHAASLRLIPGLDVWRPADPIETAISWACAIERKDGPSALLLSRQAVPFVTRSQGQTDAIFKGGYILRDAAEAKAVIIATGSEVGVAMAARDLLAAEGVIVRIVSMPCTSLFDRQDVTYKRNVLPDNLPRVAIEAGVTDTWWKYRCDAVVGVDRFGESAPAGEVFDLFGINPRNLADTVLETLRRRSLK